MFFNCQADANLSTAWVRISNLAIWTARSLLAVLFSGMLGHDKPGGVVLYQDGKRVERLGLDTGSFIDRQQNADISHRIIHRLSISTDYHLVLAFQAGFQKTDWGN